VDEAIVLRYRNIDFLLDRKLQNLFFEDLFVASESVENDLFGHLLVDLKKLEDLEMLCSYIFVSYHYLFPCFQYVVHLNLPQVLCFCCLEPPAFVD
jgi:hypothetical protein